MKSVLIHGAAALSTPGFMPRYLKQREFPAYSYVNGRFPHPDRDPLGHSHGVEQEDVAPPKADNWHSCESYLWGVDLFNAGFYWEAHEAWEQVWIGAGRKGTIADFLKALIKLAAAGVKARENRSAGVERHARRCAELLSSPGIADETELFGLHLPTLLEAAQLVADEAERFTTCSVADNQNHTLPFDLVLRFPYQA